MTNHPNRSQSYPTSYTHMVAPGYEGVRGHIVAEAKSDLEIRKFKERHSSVQYYSRAHGIDWDGAPMTAEETKRIDAAWRKRVNQR